MTYPISGAIQPLNTWGQVYKYRYMTNNITRHSHLTVTMALLQDVKARVNKNVIPLWTELFCKIRFPSSVSPLGSTHQNMRNFYLYFTLTFTMKLLINTFSSKNLCSICCKVSLWCFSVVYIVSFIYNGYETSVRSLFIMITNGNKLHCYTFQLKYIVWLEENV